MRGSNWSSPLGEEHRIGHYTVRTRRSLGEGGFAFIHLVEDTTNGRELVLKRSNLNSDEGRATFKKEASIMRSLAHPNIVQTLTAVELTSINAGAILMEYCPRGHLLDALNRLGGRRMDEERVLSIICDVTSALKYLHDKRITHRDIKLENILGSAAGLYKLCDFGSCVQGRVPLHTAEQRVNEEEVVEKTTTQMYRAPEMVDLYMERELTEKVDVWALGCVLYAVCYLKHPFQDAGNLGILNARIRIPSDSGFSDGLNELMLRMFCASASHRPSVAEVESCLGAVRKGHPLPPARNPMPPDHGEREVHGTTSAAGSGSVSVSGSGSSEGSNTAHGGKGNASAPGLGTRGGRSGQVKQPPTPSTRSSGSTTREPQLNPNSVAARRLACRKEGKEAVVGRENSGVDPPHGVRKITPQDDRHSTTPSGDNREPSDVRGFAVQGQAAKQTGTGWPIAAGVTGPESPASWQAGVGSSATPRANSFGRSNFADFDQFMDTNTGAFQAVGEGFGFGTAGFSAFPGDEDPFAVEPSSKETPSSRLLVQQGREASFERLSSLERTSDSSKLIDLAGGGDAGGAQGRGSDVVEALGSKLERAFPTPLSSSSGSMPSLDQQLFAAPGSSWGPEALQGSGTPRTGNYRPPPIATDFGPGVLSLNTSRGSKSEIGEPTKQPFQVAQGVNSSGAPQLGLQSSLAEDTPTRMRDHHRSQSTPSMSADGGDPPWISSSESLLTPGRRSTATPLSGQQEYRAAFPGSRADTSWNQSSSGGGAGGAGQVADPNWQRPNSLGGRVTLRISRSSLSPMGHATPSPSNSPSPGQAYGSRSSISSQQQQQQQQQQRHQWTPQGVQHQQGGMAANVGPGGWSGGLHEQRNHNNARCFEGYGSSPGNWHGAGARNTSPSHWGGDRIQQELASACQQQAQQHQQYQQYQQCLNRFGGDMPPTQGS